MTLDLDGLVEQERESDSLTSVRDDLYEVARDYIAHLKRERDEHDSPHTKEAQKADDDYQNAKLQFDRLRAIRQSKINRAVFSPGDISREVEKNLTETEQEYVERISEADEDLRRTSTEDGEIGQPLEVSG